MQYLGKEYSTINLGDRVKFLIDGKNGELAGKSLYKLYALSKNSVDALTHLYVYATHPNQFNDPFDCDETLLKFDDINAIKRFWEQLYPNVVKLCKNDIEQIKVFTNKAYKTYMYKKMGVLCLTSSWDSLPMWSAYTQHQGFCLEYNVSAFPFQNQGVFPVNYIAKEDIQPVSVKENGVAVASLFQTMVKTSDWEYEHEWRMLIDAPDGFYMKGYGEDHLHVESEDEHDRRFKYTLRSLRSVTFGLKFFEEECVVIGSNEYEYYIINPLKNEILDFLSRTKICTYALDNAGFGTVVQRLLNITQLSSNRYRIKMDLS